MTGDIGSPNPAMPEPTVMHTIKLVTQNRDHVARIKVPPAVATREVIIWGGRAFFREGAPFPPNRAVEYVEVGVYSHRGEAEKPGYAEGDQQ